MTTATQTAADRVLLTVSVAAYNGEATLAEALRSCLPGQDDRLEVIVVDDGSTDATARIAGGFAERFPGTFRLIRQSNGGYGSAVGAALAAARGRYFRTLDCDDWFDPRALRALLDFLQDAEADAVFTGYRTVQEGRVRREFPAGPMPGGTCTFDQLGGRQLDMEIHAVTFRTRMLRGSGLQLPRRCSYTDMAYTFYGLAGSETLAFCPVMLYNYSLGRDGQSVSMENYRRHFSDYDKVTRLVLDAAEKLPDNAKGALLRGRARDIAQYGIELLLRFPPSAETRRRLAQYDRALRSRHASIAAQMKNKNTRLLRASRYAAYPLVSWWARNKQPAARARQGGAAAV